MERLQKLWPLFLTACFVGAIWFGNSLQNRQVLAAESAAKAQWQQVYWLKRQAQAIETPCCMCE